MSRTYKDRPHKFSAYTIEREKSTVRVPCVRMYTHYQTGKREEYDYFEYLGVPGAKTKKRKKLDTEWHWMNTPSWWTHMYMIRPRRTKENQQLRNIKNIEEFDFIDVKRKNHLYYW